MSLVLASGSPRRRQLLSAAGIPLRAVRPPDIPEVRAPGEAPVAYARRLAREKAGAVDAPGAWVLGADTVVHIGEEIYEKPLDPADARRILGELSGRWHRVTTGWCLRWGGGPAPEEPVAHSAIRLPRREGGRSSGRESERWTVGRETLAGGFPPLERTDGGCCALSATASEGRRLRLGHVTTRVRFRQLGPEAIAHYVASGEGADKAGSYGIQEIGVMLVDRVVGCFTTVVGLPMTAVLGALAEVGIHPQMPEATP